MSAPATGQPTNELAELVGPFWSEAKTCEALNAAPASLAARCNAGTLLGLVTADGDRVYPVFQFARHQNGRVENKPALVAMLEPLRSFDPWTVAVLLKTPAPELDGATPIEWAREGGAQDALRDLAHVVAREWAADELPSSP